MGKRIIIYGPSKIGISTFLAENESSLVIDTFNSLDHLKVNSVPLTPRKDKEGNVLDLTKLEIIHSIIDRLIEVNTATPDKNSRDTLVIDHLLGLERIIYRHVCDLNKIEDIEYLNYGKGHHLAFLELQKLLSKIDLLARHPVKAMNVIIAAHSTHETYTTLYQENMARSVLSTTIKPPKENVAEFLKVWADGLYYADDFYSVTGGYFESKSLELLSEKNTMIFGRARPNFDAGTRISGPNQMKMKWEVFSKELGLIEQPTDQEKQTDH